PTDPTRRPGSVRAAAPFRVHQALAEERDRLLHASHPAGAGAGHAGGGVPVAEAVDDLVDGRGPQAGGSPHPPTATHDLAAVRGAEAAISSAMRPVPLAISLLGSL